MVGSCAQAGWRGRRESDSHPQNSLHALAHIDRDMCHVTRPHHHHHHQGSDRLRCFLCLSQRLTKDVEREAGGGTGIARRRRERRLRSTLRHERMSVAMALAESTHHSAQRQKMARAGREVRVEPHGEVPEAPLPQGGSRPPCLGVSREPQVELERHVMEDLGTVCPFVQILDLPVPQMVDYVMDALRILDRPIVEQVIEVPKISCLPCPSRSPVSVPQSAEQLVEVPTVLSPLRIAEQIVGIPVPRGRGKRRVQGFLPEQSSTAAPSVERIPERIVEQTVVISPGGGLGQGSASSAAAADGAGFFELFPMEKSAECRAGGWARQLIHAERSSNGSCRRARRVGVEVVHWNRRTNLAAWDPLVGVEVV